MSNEMISVSRSALEILVHGEKNLAYANARHELRALLAKPAKPAKSECPHCLGDSMFGCAECEPEDLGEHQSEPVAWRVQRITPTGNHRLDRPLLTLATPEEWGPAWKAEPLYTRPAEQPDTGTNSDKYKAELYDEVWQLARDMGFGNVTDALMKLQSQLQGKKFR